VIAAQGELQASETLAQAARTLAQEPSSMQLRYLQTVAEIAAENNSTTIFPIPIEFFRPWIQGPRNAPASAGAPASAAPAALPAADPTLSLPPEIRKVLAPSVLTEGGLSASTLADMMQQFRVEWAQREAEPPSGQHG
jgi:hypothetical protein